MAEVYILDGCRTGPEANAIEDVESLGAELHADGFVDRERAGDGQVLVKKWELPHLGVEAGCVAEAVERGAGTLLWERAGAAGRIAAVRDEEVVDAGIELAIPIRLPTLIRGDVWGRTSVGAGIERQDVAAEQGHRLAAGIYEDPVHAPVAQQPGGGT